MKTEELMGTVELVDVMVHKKVTAMLRAHRLDMKEMLRASQAQALVDQRIIRLLQTVGWNPKTSSQHKEAAGSKVELPPEQGASTTAPAAARAPVATKKELFKCQMEGCQQPKHRLRHCHTLQSLPAWDRRSVVASLGSCLKCLDLDHGRSDGKCPVVAYKSTEGSKMICPIKKCRGKHHYLLHVGVGGRKRMKNGPVSPGQQGSSRASSCLPDMMAVQQEVPAGGQAMPWGGGATGGGSTVTGRFEVEANADGNDESAPRGKESASSGSRPLSGEDRELLH